MAPRAAWGLLALCGLLARGARAQQTCGALVGCPLAELPQAKLTADDAAAGDYFGSSVAIADGVAIVGAYGDDDGGSDAGSAYIFARDESGGGWSQVAKLTADDAGNDQFGYSVAIADGVAIVGAYADDDAGSWSGSAYIFARDESGGGWSQVAKLTADDAAGNDRFGFSVAIADGVAIVGAYGDDDAGWRSGSAYIFARDESGGGWSQVAKLTADDAAEDDHFGRSVAIADGVAIVGAAGDDDAGSWSGSAYIFARDESGGGWSQVAKLTADDAAVGDMFGVSVAIADGVAIVGAYGDGDAGSQSGSAYIFARDESGGGWSQVAKLTADDAAAGDRFGFSVAIADGVAIVGAHWDDDGGSDSGSAYIFARDESGGGWSQVAKLTADDAAADDWFGFSVAIADGVAIVGAPQDDDGGSNSGSAHLFECCGTTTCILPATPVPGYVLTAVACSDLSSDSITCETDPTCAAGYHGAPTESDYSCAADGEELSVGGCDPIVCTSPADTTGYQTPTETQLDRAAGFNVTVSGCDTGAWYEGTPAVTPCETSGPYTLSGCDPIVCTSPPDTTGYTPTETQLNRATGWDVTHSYHPSAALLRLDSTFRWRSCGNLVHT
eukprot:COSAG06_NODE_3388_length_5413_cov_5.771359_4_plen_612_part_00